MKRRIQENGMDKELLEGLSAHNADTLQLLYKNYFPMITRMVMQNSGGEDDAKDLFQEGLMVLYEKSKDAAFVLECKLNTYLYAVCKRLWLKQLHQNQKNDTVEKAANYLDEQELESDLSEHGEKERQFHQMSIALKELGEPCKTLLEDFYLNQFSMQEITEKFSYTNTNNAKTQKYKCMKRLKKIFFEHYDHNKAK